MNSSLPNTQYKPTTLNLGYLVTLLDDCFIITQLLLQFLLWEALKAIIFNIKVIIPIELLCANTYKCSNGKNWLNSKKWILAWLKDIRVGMMHLQPDWHRANYWSGVCVLSLPNRKILHIFHWKYHSLLFLRKIQYFFNIQNNITSGRSRSRRRQKFTELYGRLFIYYFKVIILCNMAINKVKNISFHIFIKSKCLNKQGKKKEAVDLTIEVCTSRPTDQTLVKQTFHLLLELETYAEVSSLLKRTTRAGRRILSFLRSFLLLCPRAQTLKIVESLNRSILAIPYKSALDVGVESMHQIARI